MDSALRRTFRYGHLRLPPLGVLDLIFFLAYRGSGSWFNAYGSVVLLLVLLTAGLLASMSSVLGVDLVRNLQDIYPFDGVDMPRNPFKKEAGPFVLFSLPAAIALALTYYRRANVNNIQSWYATRVTSQSFLPGFVILMTCFFGMLAAAALVSDRSFAFPTQVAFLVIASLVTGVKGLVLSRETQE